MKGVIVREVRALIFRLPSSTAAQAAPANPAGTHIRFGDADSSSSKPKSKGKKDVAAKADPQSRWNSHAWYYASVTLNQVVLTPSTVDRAVARMLVDSYFEMFEEILGSKGDEDEAEPEGEVVDAKEDKSGRGKGKDRGPPREKKKPKVKETKGAAGFAEVEDTSSRLIGAILTGVNRALPFAQMHLSNDSSAVYAYPLTLCFSILTSVAGSKSTSTRSSVSRIPRLSTSRSKPSLSSCKSRPRSPPPPRSSRPRRLLRLSRQRSAIGSAARYMRRSRTRV